MGGWGVAVCITFFLKKNMLIFFFLNFTQIFSENVNASRGFELPSLTLERGIMWCLVLLKEASAFRIPKGVGA